MAKYTANIGNLAIYLRKEIGARNWPIELFSRISGVSTATISNTLNCKHKPTTRTLAKMAKALECDFETLDSLIVR